MHRQLRFVAPLLAFWFVAYGGLVADASETLWLEAEHFTGIRGYCWPMGKPEIKQTAGHWGLSGPGWAAEWNQGGESGFLSIATGASDDHATVERTIEVPAPGKYFVWVRYGDWREKSERFQIQIEQPGLPPWTGRFGEQAVVEEDNEMKLYFGWAFAWDRQEAPLLERGPATIRLLSTTAEPEPRQVDVIVLSSDPQYRPRVKERPASDTWNILDSYRQGIPADLEPLARRRPALQLPEERQLPEEWQLPEAWKLRTFQDRGLVYLWNTGHTNPAETWLGDKPDRVRVPYNIIDADLRTQFETKYAGRDDVPIFSDPRVAPTFHGVGPGIFVTDAQSGEVNAAGMLFARWLDAHPDRLWGMMMNYHPGQPIGPKGIETFARYRDRYLGSISGESLGYFYPDQAAMRLATDGATTRRGLVESFSPLTLSENAAKYRQVYGRDLDANAYADVISCMSVGNMAFTPLCYNWGARTVGYESAAATSSVLPLRWAFLRGAARQHAGLTATYRSCNFGDSSTIFSNAGSFHSPQNILDNYYSVFSGAGATWYKMDIWYQYMAGSSMFYHEQGFDEFWQPGGTTVAGVQEVQLSPKGKLVDRFLRVTAQHPDRGHPCTPVAFLVDYAHGWEPAPFWPNSFKNWHGHEDRFLFGDHEKMLEEFFWTAYYPIGAESQRPITALNEVYVAGVYGDIFDVIFAYPDVRKWRTIDSYPVVIAAGEIELSADEGKRLASYVESGGTLLVADAHLTGPGMAELALPSVGDPDECDGYRWLADPQVHQSPRFRYRPIQAEGGRTLATTADGKVCCAAFDRGQGRLIYLSVPHGLSISRQAVPLLPRLIAHLSRGLMPLEVAGDVEWMVNRARDSWIVTLLNPAGQDKPQQGITPTDYRENREITIQAYVPIASAHDQLLPNEELRVEQNILRCEVPAGAVRIIEIR